jgi:hypothetical protein
MKSFVLFLGCAAFLASAAPARALPQGTVFSVSITNGPDPASATDIGAVYFELDTDLDEGCSYYGAWESSSTGVLQTDCWINEGKRYGHANCVSNAQATFNTLVQRDTRSGCTGFDRFSQPQDLALFVGLEMSASTGIIGLLQYSGAPWIYPFEATPYP